LFVGGNDSSQVPQIYGGGIYQTNSQVTGFINGLTFKSSTGAAQVLLDSTIQTGLSFQEKSGTSGTIANGATFTITIPTPRRPQLLFVYSSYNLQTSGLYFVCGDALINLAVSTIVSSAAIAVSGTSANQVTVTNNFGGSAVLLYTLTPFGAAAA